MGKWKSLFDGKDGEGKVTIASCGNTKKNNQHLLIVIHSSTHVVVVFGVAHPLGMPLAAHDAVESVEVRGASCSAWSPAASKPVSARSG